MRGNDVMDDLQPGHRALIEGAALDPKISTRELHGMLLHLGAKIGYHSVAGLRRSISEDAFEAVHLPPRHSTTTHVVIPDTQVRSGVRTEHLGWIGTYIAEQFGGRPNVKVIHLGDHWDMPSLSIYDKGKRQMEGRRYEDDVEAGNDAMRLLTQPIVSVDGWHPELDLLRGNHEDRIHRAIDSDAKLEGKLSDLDLYSPGWFVHPFLEPLSLDGLLYAHYFVNQANGNPVSGMIDTRIKNIGCSFVQGHQQGLRVGIIETAGGRKRGLVAGSCYTHSEEYRGPQGRHEWRGILVLHQVEDGDYDLMEVSLDYLCRRYEGTTLKDFLR